MTKANNKPSKTDYWRDNRKSIYLKGNTAVPIKDSYFILQIRV